MVSPPSSNCRDKEMEGREGNGGEGETRRERKAAVTLATGAIATCTTPE
jgi:hypothetical protein